MVFVAGIRDRTVGTDSQGYIWFFNHTQNFSDVMFYGSEMQEYAAWTMIWLARLASKEYMALFFIIAVIVVGCYQKAIMEYSESIEISFFVFIAMGFYLFFFNGARQGIASAIYALAIGEMLKKNFIKYAAYVLLAFLFHKTAIMLLPVYFVFNRPNTFKSNMFTAVVGSFAILFINTIVSFASSIDARYAKYGTAGGGGGYYSIGFNFLLGVFFMAFRNSILTDRYRYDRFLNLFLFGVMIGIVSTILRTDPSGLLRYGEYFNIVAIFMWPIVFINLTDRLSRFILGYSFVVFYLIFFVMTTTTFSNFIPYIVNPYVSDLFK